MLFVSSQVVTFASRRVEVRDRDHKAIGEVWIPHDYGSDSFTSFCFLVLSGIQFWSICLVGKKLSFQEKR